MNKKVIYIVGNSRSGTTMLGRVFCRHHDVYTFGELHFFEQHVDAAAMYERLHWEKLKLLSLIERLFTTSRDGLFVDVHQGRYTKEACDVLAESASFDPVSVYYAFLQYETRQHNKSIACEQTPRYLYYAKEILDVFPRAYVINMVRDPRDVLLSQKNKWRRRFLGASNIPLREAIRSWVNYHPYTISKLWESAVSTGMNLEKHPRFMTIRFEDIVNSPDDSVKELCEFVGIDFEKTMLDVPKVGSSTGKDRPDLVGIDASHSGRWMKGGLTKSELAVCERATANGMSYFGYKSSALKISSIRYGLSMCSFVAKALISLMLNLHRTRDLRDTLRRRLMKSRKCI